MMKTDIKSEASSSNMMDVKMDISARTVFLPSGLDLEHFLSVEP